MKKICFKWFIGLFSLIGFSVPVIAQITTENFFTFSNISFDKGADISYIGLSNLQADAVDSEKNISPEATTLKIITENKKFDLTLKLVDSNNREIASKMCKGNMQGESINYLTFREKLSSHSAYELQFKDSYGKKYITSSFWVGDNVPAHTIPKIIANDREVTLNDPNFDIMKGVQAVDDEGTDITKNVVVNGAVNIHKEGIYPITYTITDKNNLSNSKTIQITVISSGGELFPPTLDSVSDHDVKVTGKGTSGNKIIVQMGLEKYREIIQADGSFLINLEKPFPAGTGITAYIEGLDGSQSDKVYSVVVKSEETIVSVNKIDSGSTTVTGKAPPLSQVEVAVNNTREHVFSGIADSSGNFVINMNENTYPAGTPVKIISGKHIVSVIVYPKKVQLDTLVSGDTQISGIADKNSTVYFLIDGKTYIFSTNSYGNFSGKVDSVVSGNRLLFYQESNGIKSEISELVVSSYNG